MDDEDEVQILLNRFLQWTREHDIVAPKAELRYCGPASGFGFFAKEYLRSNDLVVQVPKEMMITSAMIADLPDYAALLYGLSVRLEPFEVLVLFFYREKAKGSASSWAPYIDVLPRTFSTPLSVNPDLDVNELPVDARGMFEKQKTEVESMRSKFAAFLKDFDEPLFLWAWHVVNTRCIFCENRRHALVDCANGDQLAVVPLMDMMNHSPEAQCIPGFDKHTQSYRVTVSGKGVREDGQLYVCYGSHGNAKLWVEYGFHLNDNSCNRVDINIDLLLALVKKIGVDVKRANEQIARKADFSCSIYASDERISYGLRRTCVILEMPEYELPEWQEIVYDLDDEHRSRLEIRVIDELAQRIRAKLKDVKEEFAWLWTDQLRILQAVLDED